MSWKSCKARQPTGKEHDSVVHLQLVFFACRVGAAGLATFFVALTNLSWRNWKVSFGRRWGPVGARRFTPRDQTSLKKPRVSWAEPSKPLLKNLHAWKHCATSWRRSATRVAARHISNDVSMHGIQQGLATVDVTNQYHARKFVDTALFPIVCVRLWIHKEHFLKQLVHSMSCDTVNIFNPENAFMKLHSHFNSEVFMHSAL